VIVGAGGPNPRPGWGFINQGGPAVWVKPDPVETGPTPAPTPAPSPPAPSPTPACSCDPALLRKLAADVQTLLNRQSHLDARSADIEADTAVAATEAQNAAARASDIKDTLAKGAAIEGGIALSFKGGGLRDVRASFDVTNRG
jgi:hypothetical protein